MNALKGSKGQLFYPTEDFAKEIMGLDPRASGTIVEIYRRKDVASPVGHEFLIVGILTAENIEVYLRLDRRPTSERHWPGIFLLSSKVHASDSVSFTVYSGLPTLLATDPYRNLGHSRSRS